MQEVLTTDEHLDANFVDGVDHIVQEQEANEATKLPSEVPPDTDVPTEVRYPQPTAEDFLNAERNVRNTPAVPVQQCNVQSIKPTSEIINGIIDRDERQTLVTDGASILPKADGEAGIHNPEKLNPTNAQPWPFKGSL